MVRMLSVPTSADDDRTTAIASLISDVLGADYRMAAEPTLLTGDFWATMHRVRVDAPQGTLDLVLRSMPDSTAGLREGAVQEWAAQVGIPTPTVLARGAHPSFGTYVIMEFAPGTPPLAGLSLSAAGKGFGAGIRRIPGLLAGAAMAIHGHDSADLRRHLVEAAVDTTALDPQRFETAIADIATAEGIDQPTHQSFADLARTLDATRPLATTTVLVHGDLHPFNILVTDDGRTTVVDWTNACIAPPEMEIGFAAGLIRCAPVPVPPALCPATRRLTGWMADRCATEYEQRAGPLDRSAVRWWEAVQYSRCLAELVRARTFGSEVVGPTHPFEQSADDMVRNLERITGVRIALPLRLGTSHP
jgi:aminoglycoside phosphotransferase (APT) family kinase protein